MVVTDTWFGKDAQVHTSAQFKAMSWCVRNDWGVQKEHLVSQPKLNVITSKIQVRSVAVCARLLGHTVVGISWIVRVTVPGCQSVMTVCCGAQISGLWCTVIGWEVPDIVKDCGVQRNSSWIWTHHDPLKCWWPVTEQHSVTSQKTWILNNTAVRITCLTWFLLEGCLSSQNCVFATVV
jgi:hypothetical protein